MQTSKKQIITTIQIKRKLRNKPLRFSCIQVDEENDMVFVPSEWFSSMICLTASMDSALMICQFMDEKEKSMWIDLRWLINEFTEFKKNEENHPGALKLFNELLSKYSQHKE